MKTALTSLALAAAALSTPVPASAAWMGLPDGDYVVSLQCTFSSVIDCTQPHTGTLSIAGSGATAMAFDDLNGETFAGDPHDETVAGPLVDTEASALQNTPFSFLSLRLITDGAFDGFQTGDLWWVYCENVGASSCSPRATGLWSARLVGTVDEPPALAAALLALALAVSAGRSCRRAAAPACPTAA